MKRVLQKQRSALKFLASARAPHIIESASTRVLLTAKESDNLYVTLEEDFNNVLKTVTAEGPLHIEKKMQKLWSLVSMIRRSEVMLRELYEKTVSKQTATTSSVTNSPRSYDTRVEVNQVVNGNVKAMDGIESPKSDMTSRKMSFTVSKSEMEATKEIFEREKQYLLKEIINLKEKLSKTVDNVQDLTKIIKGYEEQTRELKHNLEMQINDTAKEFKLRQDFENRVKELQKQLDAKEKEIETISFQFNNAKEQMKLLECTVNEQKLTNELLNQNNSHLSQKLLKIQTEYNSLTSVFDELTQKYTSLSNQTKIYEENAAKMLTDINKNVKLKDAHQKKLLILESQKKEWFAEREKFLIDINILEKDVKNWRHLFDNEKQKVGELKRDKELLQKSIQRVNVANDEQQRIFKIEMRMKDQLEKEVNRLNNEINRQNDLFLVLQTETERLKSKNTELIANIKELQDSKTEKEVVISELKKEFNDLEISYKHQNILLENIRSDKNMYSQNLLRAKEELTQLKQEIKILNQKISAEEENLTVKENELLAEKSILQKLEQEKEKLYGEISHYKELLRSTHVSCNELQEEVKKLNNVIQKLDSELQKKDKLMLQVIGEQELTSTQLLQKTEEIAQLSAKQKLWEVTKEKIESECKDHMEEIKNLKIEIKRLNNDKAALNRNLSAVSNLRSDVFTLERELMKERIKCRALEEELQNPLNIHRWRKLEGTDPDSYELIMKIQLLQKRLLTKSEIAAEKEQQLTELETLCENLRTTTAKLSPSEITNKLYFLRKESEEKSRKIKKLMVEMSMYESHATDCKLELDRKNKELEELKKDYFKQKQFIFNLKNRKSTKNVTERHNTHDNETSALVGGFLIKSAQLPVIKIYDQK